VTEKKARSCTITRKTDSLYIALNSRPNADSREVAEGLVIDFGANINVAGIDIDTPPRSSTSTPSKRFGSAPSARS